MDGSRRKGHKLPSRSGPDPKGAVEQGIRGSTPREGGRDGDIGAASQALGAPSTMTAAQLLPLQRTAGNRAACQLLLERRRGPSRQRGATAVQRFPATALGAPVDWKALTASVARPGEGISGGVYILTSKQPRPQIPKVVAKPVFGTTGIGTETGEQLTFGDRALARLLDINTPVSKVVNVGQGEHSNLADLLRAHQPPVPPDNEEAKKWKDVSAAHSFVVMSEVPQARSVSSFADKAATDTGASTDLHRIVFDPNFIRQLARMAVGDLLIGNADRMVFGAMNLGNIMISRTHGVYAIDTTAVLPKAVDPKDIVSGGGSEGGGWNTAQVNVDDPAERIDGFFRVVIDRLKQGAIGQPHGDGAARPAWQIFEETYNTHKNAIAARYNAEFRDAALEVGRLVETAQGRQQMKALTAGFQGTRGAGDLSYTMLKANAMYLAGRAKTRGVTPEDQKKSHNRAAQESAAYVAYRQLLAFNPGMLTVPTDRFGPGAAGAAPKKSRTAEVESLSPLMPGQLGWLWTDLSEKLNGATPFDQSLLDDIGAKVDESRRSLAALGTKTRGLPFASRELPRNRQLAGNFVVDSYLVGGGALRARYAVDLVTMMLGRMSYLLDGNLRPNQAAQVLPKVQSILAAIPTVRTLTDPYLTQLETLGAEVAKFAKVSDSAARAKALLSVHALLTKDLSSLAAAEKNRPDAVAHALGVMAR